MQRTLIMMSLGLGLAACAADDGDEGIFISKNVLPADGCTFSSSAAELFNPHGTVSVFSPEGYTMYPQLVSRISATENNVQQRTIQMRGSRVDIEILDPSLSGISGDGITRFESRFAAPLAPNGGITDAAFQAIPTAFLQAVAQAKGLNPMSTERFSTEVIVHAKVYGDLSGSEVVSQEYEYPVTICNNCVTNVLGACPLPLGTTVLAPTNPCSAYQDGFSDCCVSGGNVVCPGVVATMAQ
ncbi:MAG: hypothetical protein H0T46_08725 [Deltaproteobacteria bacterium]|nr:hypothetical protein [Deltaproteobacteria bacterium]